MPDVIATQNGEPDLSEILKVRRDKLSALQSEGRDPFTVTKFQRTAFSEEIRGDYDSFENRHVAVAGRVMAKRGMGKAIFADLQDAKGRIQIYIRADSVTPEEFADFRKVDVGDIVGAEGYVFRTKMGEISVHCEKTQLLSKSLRPLPEKFHGLTDKEIRYRQRYVDLIVNPEVKRTFELRSKFIKFIRDYMDGRGYIEVETPVLNTLAGGAAA